MKNITKLTPALLILFSIFFGLACNQASQPASETNAKANSGGTNANASNASNATSKATPAFTGQKAKFSMETPAATFEKDLVSSLKSQKAPIIQMEFADGKKIDLPEPFKNALKQLWDGVLQFSFDKNLAQDESKKYKVNQEHSMLLINRKNDLRRTEIDSPDGKRRFTEEEIQELVKLVIDASNQRYEELNKNFNTAK